MLRRVSTRNALESGSARRCRRYQLVCGILRSSSAELRTRSRITSGKFPSRNSRSAAFTASSAFVQRTQSRLRSGAFPSGCGSNESRPSISARNCRSTCARCRSAAIIDALPLLRCGLVSSVIAPFGSPPSVAASSGAMPVANRSCPAICGCGKRSCSRLRRSMILLLAGIPKNDTAANHVQENICDNLRLISLGGASTLVGNLEGGGVTRRSSSLRAIRPGAVRLPTNERNHHALHVQLARRNEIRIHRVLRLQIFPAAIDYVTLERCLAVNQRGDDVAVVRVFAVFEDDNVAVENVRIDHRIAADSQREGAAVLRCVDVVSVERHMAINRLLGQRRHAGWNLAVNRYIHDPHLLDRRDERARFSGMAVDKTFPLECVEVLHDRRLTGEAEVLLNLARTRRDSFLALFALNESEDVSLTIGEHGQNLA